MAKQAGFTLVELLIVLTLVVISFTLVVPAYRNIVANSQVTTQIDQLVAAINFARTEAVYRHVVVTLCPRLNNHTCGDQWQNGWLVFTDPKALGRINSDSQILKVYSAVLFTNKLAWQGARSNHYLQMDPLGSTHGQAGTFIYCMPGNKIARAVIVSQTGRVRVTEINQFTGHHLVCN